MESSSSFAWVHIPRVLRCALTKLAESTASTSERVRRVEEEMECERIRFTEKTARLLDRIDTLEASQREHKAALDRLETSLRQADISRREEQRDRDDQLNKMREETSTVTEQLFQSLRNVDKTPRVVARKEHEPRRCSTNYDQLGGEALAATALLQDQMQARPSREECHVIAEDAVARQVAPLKADVAVVLRYFRSQQVEEKRTEDEQDLPQAKTSFTKCEAKYDDAYFLRRCEAVEKRCNEVVATLNQKAYKVDVNRAFENMDRQLRKVLETQTATSPPQPSQVAIPPPSSLDNRSPGEDVRQLVDSTRQAQEMAVTDVMSRLETLERCVKTAHSGLAKDVVTLRDELRRRQQGDPRPRIDQSVSPPPSTKAPTTRDKNTVESTRRAIEELRRDFTALAEIKNSNNSFPKGQLESQLRADLEALVEDRFSRCEPIVRRGRWLWRSGHVARGGLIPWDLEAANSARDSLIWQQQSSTHVNTTLAGLYRVAVGVFTRASATIHLCVGGEVVLTREWEGDISNVSARGSQLPVNGCSNAAVSHALRQTKRYSAGEITCVCIDEFVALPASAELSVRFDSGLHGDSSSQGFFSVIKV